MEDSYVKTASTCVSVLLQKNILYVNVLTPRKLFFIIYEQKLIS